MSNLELKEVQIGKTIILRSEGTIHTIKGFKQPLGTLSQVIITCDFNDTGLCPVSFKQIREEFELLE